MYGIVSDTPRTISNKEIEFFMIGLYEEMVSQHNNVLSEELDKKY
ncbi:hypothetical protein [Candidatus Ichthyocystis hellenicum]|nr:hypothetical protein [Candidatus Ichthyocystis hellenicum]